MPQLPQTPQNGGRDGVLRHPRRMRQYQHLVEEGLRDAGACFRPLDQPGHADALLEGANR
jgi:hypothetical protein